MTLPQAEHSDPFEQIVAEQNPPNFESKVESDINLCLFYNCINEFNESN